MPDKYESPYTENLADFGACERATASKLLGARLPAGFDDSGVRLAMNKRSGNVFLVNDDYQCAMMNGDTIEVFHSLPYGGLEGFLIELMEHKPGDMHRDDREYMRRAIRESDSISDDDIPVWWRRAR